MQRKPLLKAMVSVNYIQSYLCCEPNSTAGGPTFLLLHPTEEKEIPLRVDSESKRLAVS